MMTLIILNYHFGFCPLGFIPTTEETMEDGIFQLCPEMQKVADPADISVLFFFQLVLISGQFWVILGPFWQFWVIFGSFWTILGHFGAILGHFG